MTDNNTQVPDQSTPACTEIVQQLSESTTQQTKKVSKLSTELIAFYTALQLTPRVVVTNGVSCACCIHPDRLEKEAEYLRDRSITAFGESAGVPYNQALAHVKHSGLMDYGKSRAGIVSTAERFVRKGLLADAKASDGVKALELIARLEGHLKTDTQESTETILDAIRKQSSNKQQSTTIIEDAEYVIVADDLPTEQDK
jgi:hypothetical protein